ncbi:hypothetical protein [Roseofilum casamattae]|uniref:CopG family transcriptional regulator n=1 Tax=Roseofilum casamattae BLCC-M143 TaxID=3022442 RepID=A0ABT7C0G8_9CYAN|nr:hypothetical protein [Roseofilum casamattae]MDJ1184552.1 hypothetical protein [Roseofilum casamattae BLCC-M143]
MKARKKQITVYLTAENEDALDEYRQREGTSHYSRAVNDILAQFFHSDRLTEDFDDRLLELEKRFGELQEQLDDLEGLRSQIAQLTERCDRILAVNSDRQQALTQAREREQQFRQQLSDTIHTVQARSGESQPHEGHPSQPPKPTRSTPAPRSEDPEEFDILDAELIDSPTEDLLFKLSQELGLL